MARELRMSHHNNYPESRTSMKNLTLLTSAALLLIANAASATTLVASDNFQQANLGAVTNQSSGTGWAGNWQSAATGAATPTVVKQGAPADGNQALQFSANNDNAAFRVLNQSISGDVFIDFMFQYSGNALGDNDFLGLWIGNWNGPNIGLKGNCGGGTAGCINDAFARTNGGGGPYLPVNMQQNVTYHLYGHLYKTANSMFYNKFDAWINPTALEMSTLVDADVMATGASTISSFNTIGFRSANIDTITVRIDDLKVSVVPEPASIALFGLALAGMAGVRRAKRK
ncbi:PEP-CTERM sorting domain-containing protein [Massilia eurypsychrophila]|uniref:PEP-CTERM sorting domain-containing protein n=2 Tax=Massilia eurypsychrophila TaxID=1485217 RepID=A0A2G8TMB2_9BURK|nr:PEP-CTERM sorting domain-containing protein [Massilia eurypsychrophila]